MDQRAELISLANRIRAEQAQRWTSGQKLFVENYVEHNAELRQDRDALLDVVYGEYCLREKLGEAPLQEEYFNRFLELKEDLQRLFEVHQAIGDLATPSTTSYGTEDVAETGSFFSPGPSADADRPIPPPQESELRSNAEGNHIGHSIPPTDPPEVLVRHAEEQERGLESHNRYLRRRILGEGTFGTVYLAMDTQLDRLVAVKVAKSNWVERLGGLDTFIVEAKTVARMDHQAIVPVYDIQRTPDGGCFVVSKYVEGADLSARMAKGTINCKEAARIVATVADALHHAHRRGIIHRDIKPSNILIDHEDRCFLADFGIALLTDQSTDFGQFVGTPAYMSPEQANGESHLVDARSDVFSLGIVLYELLTGVRPFVGPTVPDILLRIVSEQPAAPRTVVSEIPHDLERICLKCIAKRASDRYANASELGKELQTFLVDQPADAGVMASEKPQGHRVKFRGLRAFSEHDSDFYLDLLPGPRDREGLPPIISFWKSLTDRAEVASPLRVGLIYGPSGCGKSSLIKAGLLPLLSSDIDVIYVDSTVDNLEGELLNRLRGRFRELSETAGLVETLTTLRRSRIRSDRRLLIVLDQFEQWLSGRSENSSRDLIAALRQCDGQRIQALILVRDDFWLAANRFMQGLDIPIQEGANATLFDLFDKSHAIHVLSELGRSLGRLPVEGELSEAEKAFLEKAVEGLSTNGHVVSVRISLFAEMMKDRPWIPDTLKRFGDSTGIAEAFFDDVLGDQTTRPSMRLHLEEARRVLSALLPPRGSDIRGAAQSFADLAEGRTNHYSDEVFKELLLILDHELKLITPVAVLSESDSEQSDWQPKYQLTHDYLVPALRTWLTRNQRDTRQGRAQLRLTELAVEWGLNPEPRKLPPWWELPRFWLWTRRRSWNSGQQQMMHAAERRYAVRAVALLVTLTVVALWLTHGLRSMSASSLVSQLQSAEIGEVPAVIEELRTFWPEANELLASWRELDADPQLKLRATLAQPSLAEPDITYLLMRMLDPSADFEELRVLREALFPHRDELVGRLWPVVEDSTSNSARRFRAACVLSLFDSGSAETPHALWKQYGPFVAQQATLAAAESPASYAALRALLEPGRARLAPAFVPLLSDPANDSARVWASVFLADLAHEQPSLLIEAVLIARVEQFSKILLALKNPPRTFVERELRTVIDRPPPRSTEVRTMAEWGSRRANAAIALFEMGQSDQFWELLDKGGDPTTRSLLIDRVSRLGIEIEKLTDRFLSRTSAQQQAVVMMIGSFDERRFKLGEKEKLSRILKLEELYRNGTDAGLHGAIRWTLGKWQGQDKVRQLDAALAGILDGGRNWYVNSQGQTMVTIVPTEFLLGSPENEPGRIPSMEAPRRCKIQRVYAISAHEVTISQVDRWSTEALKAARQHDFLQDQPHLPVHAVTWIQAARYCNWLSTQEGLPDNELCYVEDGQDRIGPVGDFLKRTGYRLPTEAEWEFACRAGSVGPWSFGYCGELFPNYGWSAVNSPDGRKSEVGLKLPNTFGLYDMYGNAAEWCHDAFIGESKAGRPGVVYGDVGSAKPPKGDRIVRGKASGDTPPPRSAYRDISPESKPQVAIGFRISRTLLTPQDTQYSNPNARHVP